ncbi:structural maintenance of chromosomes protein 5 [Nematocida parisii]|nr:structural maintenance of chromosomes protein 5 [Nematocida parisii]KAI5126159.1 structural maintenance of chromosomes protein 5 [Nematocida parisii]KAI5140404.1 structural maintenance of chromosomes protein 5 [Nematocida parisii]
MGNTFLHSLSLTNFQKYANTTFVFSPNGNLITGLNGSGKSTIASAIALTLGGTSKTLGKSLGVNELIKYGEVKAVCELVIRTGHRSEVSKIVKINGKERMIDISISRTITAAGSTYKINNLPATLNQVKEITECLNIQINNLGQFLPQDKVTEFSTLTEEEQLETTLMACNPELLEKKRELEEIVDNVVGYRQKLQKELMQQTELKKKMDVLEEEQAKLKEFLDRKEHISLLQGKIKWVEYQTIKNQRDQLKSKLKKEEAVYQEHQSRIECLEKECAKETEQIDKIKRDIESGINISGFVQCVEEIQRSEAREKFKKEELEVLRNREARLAREKLEMPQPSGVKQMQPPKKKLTEHLQAEYSSLEEEYKNSKIEDSTWQVESALKASEIRNIEVELRRESEVEGRLMEALKSLHRDTYTVVEMLKRSDKKWEVDLPAILTMKITREEYTEEISSQLNVHALTCFVCHTKESFHGFIQEFKERNNLAINVVQKQQSDIVSSQASAGSEFVQFDDKYKMTYLSDCIDAPPAVKEFLNIFSKLSRIPVTKLSLADEYEFFNRYKKISRIISNKKVVEIRRSHYTKDETLTIYPIQKGIDILTKPYDSLEKKEALNRLIAEREKRTEYRQNVLKKRELIEKRLKELKQIKETDVNEQEKYERVQRALQAYKERTEEITKECEEIKNKIKCTEDDIKIIKKEEVLKWKNLQLAALFKTVEELSEKSKAMKSQYENLQRIQAEVLGEKQILKEHHTVILKLNQEISELKHQAIMKQAEADSTYHVSKENDQSKKEKLKALPSCIKTLTTMLAQEKAKVELSIVDYSAIEEYEACKSQFLQMEKFLRKEEADKEKYEITKHEKESNLKEELDQIISCIDKNASALFSSAGIGSEISIEYNELPRRWKLVLKVRFRAEGKLEILSAGRHSGGEKAVSIILYLLSIQRLSNAPFLLVDEINQGMDAGHERTIHSMLVGNRSISEKQSIVITPKLISELDYAPTTKVHVVIETQ